MAEFTIEIAGHTAAVTSVFASAKDYCRAYLTEKQPEFSIHITETDLRFEQEAANLEALEEGLRLRVFPDPFLDRAAIQRKLAEHLFRRDVLMLHGSAIALDGKGYLFTAKCGTGKSTHTRLWRETFGHRAVMVNDDKPFLSLSQGGVLLCGSPWSGKHGLHSNLSVPLAGICILERGEENRIWPISMEDALPMLLHQCYCPLDPAEEASFRQKVALLAQQIPLWRMACTKDPQAAVIAQTAMAGNTCL